MSSRRINVIAVALLGAGILHFVALPERVGVSFLAGMVFVLFGLGQLALADGIFYGASRRWVRVAGVSSAVLVILFVITQIIGAIYFKHFFEPWSVSTVVRKLLEVLIVVMYFYKPGNKR